jgi:hypothetical protein
MAQALAASSSLFDDFDVLEPLNQQPQYLYDHQQAACGLLDKSGHAVPAQYLHNDYSATFF